MRVMGMLRKGPHYTQEAEQHYFTTNRKETPPFPP
jgi:hypothetical protein